MTALTVAPTDRSLDQLLLATAARNKVAKVKAPDVRRAAEPEAPRAWSRQGNVD